MKYLSLSAMALVCVVAACDSTAPSPSLVSDSVVNADVATSAGEAIVTQLGEMRDVLAGQLPGIAAIEAPSLVSASRTVTCYDANGTVVAGCSPMSSVRKVVSHVVLTGGREGTREVTGGKTVTWSGAVHRVSDDTLVRNFNTAQPPAEVSRTHSNVIVAHDTTTFTDGTNSRSMSEAAHDTVKALTFNLPRSSNPFPVSGSIVRVDSVKVVATNGTKTESRDVVRRIEVTFPADAQGNVALKINDKTCSLNLATRVVTGCQ